MSSFPSAAAAVVAGNALKTIYTRPSEAASSAGDSGPLNSAARELVVGLDVTSVSVGGSLTVVLEHQLGDVWFPLYSFAALSAAGQAQAHVGVSAPVNVVPSGTLRLRWDVVAGATFSASIVGR